MRKHKKTPQPGSNGGKVTRENVTPKIRKFSNTTSRIYSALLSGNKTTVQLVRLTGIADPRSHIRYLRAAGVPVADYWISTPNSRIKVYFIK
jgi:hypothetical protein